MTLYPELKTLRDFIRFAATSFNQADLYYGHGTDNAWDEAVALVLHTLRLPHDAHPTILDANLVAAERKQLFDLIQQRIQQRVPVPYLTHEAWFFGLPFYVDERVLIPRSPLAELIEKQFEPWIDPYQVSHILDLCTGSGCIAIACAKTFSDAKVDASDISKEALAVAKINLLRHHLEEEIELFESDLFRTLPKKKYDIIISNPPYVSSNEIQNFPQEFNHEPKIALEGGNNGLDIILRILQDAKKYLQPHGVLIVEVGNSETALTERYPDAPFTWLQFERGADGVFLLTAEQLEFFKPGKLPN